MELTEFAAELTEFSSPKQYSRNSIPPVSNHGDAVGLRWPGDSQRPIFISFGVTQSSSAKGVRSLSFIFGHLLVTFSDALVFFLSDSRSQF